MAGRLVILNATSILSNSAFALNNFFPGRLLIDNRFRVIPNGVDGKIFRPMEGRPDIRRKLGIATEAYVVGHVGRFDPAKNHDTIFRVAKEVIRIHPDTRFIFCGKDTNNRVFNELCQKFGLQEYCIGLGLQENVAEVFNAFDVFIFPSLTEGQPNALIEAMFSGLPVLSSAIPPIMECTPERYHKWLVQPLNVARFVDILSALRSGKVAVSELVLEEHAREKFDISANFVAFKRLLEK